MFHGAIPSHLPVFVRFPFVMVIAAGLLARRPRRGRSSRRRRRRHRRRSGINIAYIIIILYYHRLLRRRFGLPQRITRGKLFFFFFYPFTLSLYRHLFTFRLSALHHRTPVHCWPCERDVLYLRRRWHSPHPPCVNCTDDDDNNNKNNTICGRPAPFLPHDNGAYIYNRRLPLSRREPLLARRGHSSSETPPPTPVVYYKQVYGYRTLHKNTKQLYQSDGMCIIIL